MSKGMTERQMSMLIWMIIGVAILLLIVYAGLYFFYEIPFKGMFQ